MSAERPAKSTIRDLWVDVVRRRKSGVGSNIPFYVTLPGAAGLDLKHLIDHGLIATTESGAIADKDNRRVIAVEKDSLAVLELQRSFPGLKILQSDIYSRLHGSSPIVFPTGQGKDPFIAAVINLDFNDSFLFRNGVFPILEAVVKIATLQTAQSPPYDWTLLLTVQGEVRWPGDTQLAAQRFLAEQCTLCPPYDQGCKRLFGDPLYGRINAEPPVAMHICERVDQQHILMAFVPAQIIRRVYTMGWRVEVTHNLRYGGEAGNTAPMATWIMDFVRDPRAASTPHTVLTDGLGTVLQGAGRVTEDGDLVLL